MISISLMFTGISFRLMIDTILLLSIDLAPVVAVSPFRPTVPTIPQWRLHLLTKPTLCRTDTFLAQLEQFLMKKLSIPLNFARLLTR